MKGKLVTGALAGGLLFSGTAGAEDVKDTKEATTSVFAGTMLSNSGLDSLGTVSDRNGAQLNVASVDQLWDEGPHTLSVGARTPKLVKDRIRLNGVFDTRDSPERSWGYTGFLEGFPLDSLVLRGGVIQSSHQSPSTPYDADEGILGGFAGTRYKNRFLSVDGDVWHDGNRVDAHGYAAGIIDRFFAGVGGVSSEGLLVATAGLMGSPDAKGFGVFSKTFVDLDDERQYGKVMLADRFTFGRGFFDFQSHFASGTEMRRVATGTVLDGWAPFDAYSTQRFALVGSWNNSEVNAGGDLRGFYRPNKLVFFGLGAGDSYDKVDSDHKPTLTVELYAAIPGTPLESWVQSNIDLETGKPSNVIYFGGSGEF